MRGGLQDCVCSFLKKEKKKKGVCKLPVVGSCSTECFRLRYSLVHGTIQFGAEKLNIVITHGALNQQFSFP